jgi:F0F1-type ATP synthase assembly protein I
MPEKEFWRGMTTYSSLGFTLAAAVLAMFFLGYWLDGKLHTRPLLAIIGAFIGFTGGFIKLVQTLNRLQKEQEKDDHPTPHP